jgi:glutamate formiminotransferase/glutamate formiminotransferase/formiminotetrahydrofolate cyclodeaminase
VAARATLLDRHWDTIHARCVITMAGDSRDLQEALAAAAAEAVARADLGAHRGAHPHVGAIDVCPIVYTDPDRRGAAESLALDVAARLARLELPVFLYGELAVADERRERHHFRDGGLDRLTARMASGELVADFGPAAPHPTAGAVLVTARPPLAAFNLELEGANLAAAGAIAGQVRESGGGLPGVRAIAIDLGNGRMQISTNVHDPASVPLARLVAEVERRAGAVGARVVASEIVGLVPEAALRDYPEAVPIRDFDRFRGVIESRLGNLGRA